MDKILALLVIVTLCYVRAQDEFTCYKNAGFISARKDNERGAILPRSNIYVHIGGDLKSVLCRFNDSYVNADDVYFEGVNSTIVPHTVVNSTTIEAKLNHTESVEYRLACVLKKKDRKKILCRQVVRAGYKPQDIEEGSLSCISTNYESFNCTWKYQYNAIVTNYVVQYSTPQFLGESPCLTNDANNTCFWSNIPQLRDKIYLHLHGSNYFGKIEYTHLINIPEYVVANKIEAKVDLIKPRTASVQWNLSYPLDVFLYGFWHQVDYRRVGQQQWDLVKLFSHKHSVHEMTILRYFNVTQILPLINIMYEFRVRLHTKATYIKENMWSDYNVYTIKAPPMEPNVAPETCTSSFEVVEKLDKRDIYVNYQSVHPDYHNGNQFSYKIVAYSQSDEPLDIRPREITNAYFKYSLMDFHQYKFRIWPENEMGLGSNYSEVIVPNSDCMPKKTEFFTVIVRNTRNEAGVPVGKVFSLYWVPSKVGNKQCDGGSGKIDSYTIFWCQQTYGERCKEKMFWTNVSDLALVQKDFSDSAITNLTLFEKNLTQLASGFHTFGIAAVSGKYSSGVRWSSCIVDESDSPPAPTSVSVFKRANNTVLLKWDLKCSSLSAVPLGFNIVYCKSQIPDFGHCTSEVQSVQVHSPETKSLLLRDGLEPGTSYIFSISLLSYIGEGIQSKPVKIQIEEKVPSGPPQNFRVEKVSNTSVTLTWDLPESHRQNGIINKFQVSPSGMRSFMVRLKPNQKAPFTYKLDKLSPYTTYIIDVLACTAAGCSSLENRATVTMTTEPGFPSPIKYFALDVSNWRLSWNMESCNSKACMFEVRIPFNDTTIIEKTVEDAQFLSLYEIDLKCETKEMVFHIRAVGMDDSGHLLHGNWTTSRKRAGDCPPVPLVWWAIVLTGSIGVIVTILSILMCMFGWGTVKNVITRCKLKIEVPKGMEQIKEAQLKKHQPIIRKTTSDVLLPEPSKVEKTWPPRNQRTASVSSEEMHLISGLSNDHDRYARNLSGSSDPSTSSDQSSNQDSAVSSESPTSEPDKTPSETLLRQRITDHPYVRHSALPEKLSEGYVAALSVPSLPHLFTNPDDTLQKSTPNLNGAKTAILTVPNARRASTGYISMVDSDGTISPMPPVILPPLNLTKDGLPVYSRHSKEPQKTWPTSGYVTLAEAAQNPTPPGAYCKVGSNPSDFKSYVSVGEINMKFNPKLNTERWAHPVPLPVEARGFSAPHESCQRGTVVRPYTADNVPKKAPCLSKQSSGYVSQETLGSQDCHNQVVVSPKRLFNGQRPQSLVIPPNAPQSSMV